VVFEPSAVASRAEYLTSAFYLTMVSGSLACSTENLTATESSAVIGAAPGSEETTIRPIAAAWLQ
jgi:hypothetical protein